MWPIAKIRELLKPAPKTAEELETQLEAERIKAETAAMRSESTIPGNVRRP